MAQAVVRFGKMRNFAEFEVRDSNLDLFPSDHCIVRSDRGTEFGQVLCIESSDPPQRQEEERERSVRLEVLRRATDRDWNKLKHILTERESLEFAFCRERIDALGLPMILVGVEHLFGGERVIFYFIAESRVDFRELVRVLAQQLRTRIELRQIGSRDRSKLCGDVGVCGRPLCCGTWLRELAPVTLKMAKTQGRCLDPKSTCGACGRLKCCLRYENSMYLEARKTLPKRGTFVVSELGEGEVVDLDVLGQRITIRKENGERVTIPATKVRDAEDPNDMPGRQRSADPRPRSRERPPQEPPASDPRGSRAGRKKRDMSLRGGESSRSRPTADRSIAEERKRTLPRRPERARGHGDEERASPSGEDAETREHGDTGM